MSFRLGLFAGLAVLLSSVSKGSAVTKRGSGNLSTDNNNKTFIRGPVFPDDFADPCLAFDKGYWYSFATHPANTDINIQISRSKDFVNWEFVYNPDGSPRDALHYRPSWTNQTAPNTWAPDVIQLDDGSWVMYYSATYLKDQSKHCVGAATSPTIIGPYYPLNTTLICPVEKGGAIDAAGFKDWTKKGSGWGENPAGGADTAPDVAHSIDKGSGWGQWYKSGSGVVDQAGWAADNSWGTNAEYSEGGSPGQRYVVYKIDGNSIGGGLCSAHPEKPIAPGPLMLQAVKNDGVTLQGEPVQLLDNRGKADDGVVEAPTLVKGPQGQYILFFSSGCYSSPNYTVSYAVAKQIKGPYTRIEKPLLKTGDHGLFAPGGADVNWNGGEIVIHADANKTAAIRQMYVGRIAIDGDTVTI